MFLPWTIPQLPPSPFFPLWVAQQDLQDLEDFTRESLHKQASHKVNIQKGDTVCLVLFIFPSIKNIYILYSPFCGWQSKY